MEHLYKGKYRENYCGIHKKRNEPSWSVVKQVHDLPQKHKYVYTFRPLHVLEVTSYSKKNVYQLAHSVYNLSTRSMKEDDDFSTHLDGATRGPIEAKNQWE